MIDRNFIVKIFRQWSSDMIYNHWEEEISLQLR